MKKPHINAKLRPFDNMDMFSRGEVARLRDRSGNGCYLDIAIAMTENVLPFTFWTLGSGMAAAQWPGNADHLLRACLRPR